MGTAKASLRRGKVGSGERQDPDDGAQGPYAWSRVAPGEALRIVRDRAIDRIKGDPGSPSCAIHIPLDRGLLRHQDKTASPRGAIRIPHLPDAPIHRW